MKEVYVVNCCRTAVGSFGGSLKDTPAAELGAVVVKEALKRSGLNPEQVDELLSAVKADLADGGLGRRYLLDDADRLERCYTNDLILTFRRAGPFARTDGDNTYTICITLQTTATRTLAALAEYGVPPECLLTQAQAQLGNP